MPLSPPTEFALAMGTVTRRRFFQGAAMGAAALAACTRPAGAPGFTTLDTAEEALFAKLIAVMLPVHEFEMTPVREVPVMQNIDRLLGRLEPRVRKDFATGLLLFDLGAVVIGWNFARFSRLPVEAATAYCARWQAGGEIQRGLFSALKQIVGMSYWREPATWPPIHYEGPVTQRFGLPRLGHAPLPVE